MKNCGQCTHASYSGGQQQIADRCKIKVESLCYVYCRHVEIRDHVDKSAALDCQYFKMNDN